MNVFTQISQTKHYLKELKLQGKLIGFVPTMGALHNGHLELMRVAKEENDVLAVSIFVNPIQFNNPDDLKKYPRAMEKDKNHLIKIGCDVLFSPDVEEMYPEPVHTRYDFGKLENVMEGKFRSGHFNGVAVVVKKLLDIVVPDRAYFGEKDYQQLAVIQKLVEQKQLPVEIIPCPTVREQDGLAMSSRNERLNEKERAIAPFIYQALSDAKKQVGKMTPDEIILRVKNQFADQPELTLEYFEIADNKELQTVTDWNHENGARGFIAAHLGKVRLIDNIRFI